jgi:hypothetical protein
MPSSDPLTPPNSIPTDNGLTLKRINFIEPTDFVLFNNIIRHSTDISADPGETILYFKSDEPDFYYGSETPTLPSDTYFLTAPTAEALDPYIFRP